jgi:hypothetical protein
MKKVSLLAAVFALIAVIMIAGDSRFSTIASAQTGIYDPNDAALAARIKRLTDRSADSLVEHRSTGNTVSLDLGEGFQNVMLARTGSDGEPVVGCVSSLGEANEFFRRDLETGAPVASKWPEKTDTASLAARHGMSASEFEFYLKMIRDAAAQRAASPESATLNIVNGDGAGEGFNDATAATPEGGNTGTTRGEQRLQLFQFAAGIWGAFLDTNVQIDINSQFNSLSPCTTSGGVLGSAGTTQIYRDFSNAQYPSTWYHVALANKREGADLNGATPEINARFNTDVDNGCLGAGSRFYYGLNNSTPSQRINLLVVLLHEMGHGLGFSGFVNGTTGTLNQGFSDVYTRNMFDVTTGKYWHQMTDAERQASALNAGHVVWDGGNVKIASSFLTAGRDSSGRPQLYTPSTFQAGSSISHFDTANSPNLLMEPNINPGIPLTLDLTRQEMRDIGWYRDNNADLVPDTITGLLPSGGTLAPGSAGTISWTNTGGFSRNVTIELSIDGGATYPTVLAADTPNTGSFTFTVPNTPTGQGRVRVREVGFIDPAGVSGANFTIGATGGTNRTRFDYDGDGKADISVFRPSEGNWYIQNSATGGVAGQHFGLSGDMTAPADFDGDGKTDISVFRPAEGTWYRLNSSNNSFTGFQFGQNGDKPAAADFDGDSKADIVVYRPSEGTWYMQNSANGFLAVRFGAPEDKPAVGDFDGDGKADISLFRPSEGNWYRINSSNGLVTSLHFGISEDKPAPADFDGDGKTDVSVFRPSTGEWFRLNSNGGSFFGTKFGTSGDKPVAADFDGDGRADLGVYRPSDGTWYLLNSTSGFFAQRFGTAEDTPTPNSFVY